VADISSLGGIWPAVDEGIGAAAFLSLLEAISGIPGLRHDPAYFGGGTHESFAGAGLDPHCDFNIHPVSGKRRRLNALIYLNKEWQPGWGGALCLHTNPWDPEHDHVSEIVPAFNRAVILETTESSWHSVSPVDPPADLRRLSRKSFAFYLYTDLAPDERGAVEHSTIFAQRGLPRHIKAGRLLSERDQHDIEAGIHRRDRHIRQLYEREARFSAQIEAMEREIAALRHATLIGLIGYAGVEAIEDGLYADRFMGRRLGCTLRLIRPISGLRVVAYRPDTLDGSTTITLSIAGVTASKPVSSGPFDLVVFFPGPVGGRQALSLTASAVGRPAGGIDRRDLSIVVDRIELLH